MIHSSENPAVVRNWKILPTPSLISHSIYISVSPEVEVPSVDRRKESYKKINAVAMAVVQCYTSEPTSQC